MVGSRAIGARSVRKFLKAMPTLCCNHAHLIVLVHKHYVIVCISITSHLLDRTVLYITILQETMKLVCTACIEQWSCGCNKVNFHTVGIFGIPLDSLWVPLKSTVLVLQTNAKL